eukprot:869935-Amphidinium_carterae.1
MLIKTWCPSMRSLNSGLVIGSFRTIMLNCNMLTFTRFALLSGVALLHMKACQPLVDHCHICGSGFGEWGHGDDDDS